MLKLLMHIVLKNVIKLNKYFDFFLGLIKMHHLIYV